MTGGERFAELLRCMFVRECREDRAVAESRGNPLPEPADPGAEFDRWLHGALADAWRAGAVQGFVRSGEGWNGEYPGSIDVEGMVAEWPTPYDLTEAKEE